MVTIATYDADRGNGRHPPHKVGNGPPPPPVDIEGTVEFGLDADQPNGTLTLTLFEPRPDADADKALVGSTPSGDAYYIRVPTAQAARIHFTLAGPWDWEFDGDGVTLAKEPHSRRYWLEPITDPKVRTLIIKHSGNAPQDTHTDDLSNDEKFNLMVLMRQRDTGKKLAIEIDPITKNPPPVGDRKDTLSHPGPLL